MNDSGIDGVVETVRERVVPDETERSRLQSTATELLEATRRAVEDLPVEADVVQVGSTARETWVSGDRDIDIFVRFPADVERECLEEYGLAVGHEVLPGGHEEYAEHPYVKGEVDGFEVDLVPCYDLDDATDIRSAVDRTPFHTEYLSEHLDADLTDDVRVCKAFLKGIGAYGSNLRTQGFSGYLTELLVLDHGGFRPLVAAAADWHPPVRLDPGDTGSDASFDDPLVVIDPTDPGRNVAAVCSDDNLARFQHYARSLLEDPRPDLFEPADVAPIDPETVREHVRRRATTPVAVRFRTPDVVDDQLYPQLRKTRSGITAELERRGFEVLRSRTFVAEGRSILFLECAVASVPTVERHEGPPVHVRDHATDFFEAYADDPDAYGPFVEDGRYVVERDREFASAAAFLESDQLFAVGIGPDVEATLREGYDLLVGEDVADLAPKFGVDLARYFDPVP